MPIDLDAAFIREALAGTTTHPSLGGRIDASKARPAAVVVPLLFAPTRVLLVLRSAHLKDHAGEVGFPGGKPEAADADLEATALREMEEEVGVSPAHVELLGQLMPVPVITGRYMIHPFVGALREGAGARVASAEIERLVELPIQPLLDDPGSITAVSGEWRGAMVLSPFFQLDGCVLYGATAYIFYELLSRVAERLGKALPPPRIVDRLPWGDRYDK